MRSPKKRSLLCVNEHFEGKRNDKIHFLFTLINYGYTYITFNDNGTGVTEAKIVASNDSVLSEATESFTYSLQGNIMTFYNIIPFFDQINRYMLHYLLNKLRKQLNKFVKFNQISKKEG